MYALNESKRDFEENEKVYRMYSLIPDIPVLVLEARIVQVGAVVLTACSPISLAQNSIYSTNTMS